MARPFCISGYNWRKECRMLDLEALVGEMQSLAASVAETARETVERRELAAQQVQVARGLSNLRSAVEDFRQNMAMPRVGGDMGLVHAPPPAGDYTVIATDGSQVAPDHHHIAPWYVINTGCAVFRYGIRDRDRCRLGSEPVLRPPRKPGAEDAEHDGRAAAIGMPVQLEVERLRSELELASRLLDEEADAGHTVLLLDGPLVQWRMIQEIRQPQDRDAVIAVFRELLRKAEQTGTPIAGYISRSRAVEWVTLLRLTLCPSVQEGKNLCDDCKKSLLGGYYSAAPGSHHAPLAGLRDIDLARELMGGGQPGHRTDVLELASATWNKLTESKGSAGFFYLDAGPEMARVEIPHWVWEQPELLNRVHAVLWDQCQCGGGYPMVLSEAHEAAVVRGTDRQAFYTLIERVLIEQGVDTAAASAKAMSKRRPLA